MNTCGLYGLLGEKSRLPDHSALITEFNINQMEHGAKLDNEVKRPKFELNQIPLDFMSTEARPVEYYTSH